MDEFAAGIKIYLVGGAVRDQLLGLNVHERDWVVVGATPQLMLDKGFIQVGKDFPVFLHPETKEEYALARLERKIEGGYKGFSFEIQNVTLEEDLSRRDLTINAMAMDLNTSSKIIDPFHGMNDLKEKWLKHVGPAFVEDPLRVLRIARFLAKFHYLGFKIHPQTMILLQQISQSGELNYLVNERIFVEWQKAFKEKNPEKFYQTLIESNALPVVFPELEPFMDAIFKRLESHNFGDYNKNFVNHLSCMDEASFTKLTNRITFQNHLKEMVLSLIRLQEDIPRLKTILYDLTVEDAEFILSILVKCDALRRTERFIELLSISISEVGIEKFLLGALEAIKSIDLKGELSITPILIKALRIGAIKAYIRENL